MAVRVDLKQLLVDSWCADLDGVKISLDPDHVLACMKAATSTFADRNGVVKTISIPSSYGPFADLTVQQIAKVYNRWNFSTSGSACRGSDYANNREDEGVAGKTTSNS